MAEASFTDILQDRTHKYRRTLIAVCLIVTAVHVLPIRFDELSLFGIKPEAGYPHTRSVVIVVLWVVWLYHALLVGYYAQRDWKDWRSELRRQEGVPPNRTAIAEIPMYFPSWGHPSEALSKGLYVTAWKFSKGFDQAAWIGERLQANDKRHLSIPRDNWRSVRSRICWFLFVDCGLPFALSVIAVSYFFLDG
jgi:hypothetical protein